MAAKLKDVTKMKPRELAEELVKLRAQHLHVFDREAELKSALKSGATANFKEVFAGVGEVAVSAAKTKEFKGQVPELIPSAYLELAEGKRKKLVDDGLVQVVEEYTGAYYGSVTVKLF